MIVSSVKTPSAWAPIAMSLAALGIVLLHAARFGVVHEADEGTSAHLFQLLMVLQLPVIGYFAATRLSRSPGPALKVLALQAVASIAAFASVYWLT